MFYVHFFTVAVSLLGQTAEPSPIPTDKLILAIKAGDHDRIKALLRPELKKRHPPKATYFASPLIEAAARGDKDVVILLLAAGHNLEEFTLDSGTTALGAAAWAGHLPVVDVLLAAGANVDSWGRYSPLMMAAWGGHLEVVKRLVQSSANVNAQCHEGKGLNALMLAAKNGHAEIVEFLADQGGDVNRIDEWAGHDTALKYASINGHFECVKTLIKKKADVTIADSKGMTALHWSVIAGNAKVEKILKDAGAKADTEVLDRLREERTLREREKTKSATPPKRDDNPKKDDQPDKPKKLTTSSSTRRFNDAA